MEIRTDLALEAREAVRGQAEEIRGVTLEESYDRELELKVTKVVIETKNGAKIMGKPIGTYITLESPFCVMRRKSTITKLPENWQRPCGNFCRRRMRKSPFWWWDLETGM